MEIVIDKETAYYFMQGNGSLDLLADAYFGFVRVGEWERVARSSIKPADKTNK